MKILGLIRHALTIGAVIAILAGCGGSQGQAGRSGALPQTSSITAGAAQHGSWMSPGASRGDLLYAISNAGTVVYIFTYPGGKPVGTLSGFYRSFGICSDANGNVWIVNQASAKIVEYAHGGTSPIKTLGDRNFSPVGCSVDPTTGNLAAVGTNKSGAAIAVFVDAKRHPLLYSMPLGSAGFCGYDNGGNLFVDGFRNSIYVGFGELRKRATKFKEIALPISLTDAGQVQWDGKHITIGSGYAEGGGSVFRYDIRGNRAVEICSVGLNDMKYLRAFWIQGSRVVATDLGGSHPYPSILFYNYPAGGNPTKTIEYSAADSAAALTVSRAPK